MKSSFIKGAAVLGISGMLVKIIGIVYRIQLGRIIGDAGLGIFGKAYPYYAYLLVLSTAGLPPTISKLVSQHRAAGDPAGAHWILRKSIQLLALLGTVCTALLIAFRHTIAQTVNTPDVALSIVCIAPAILLVALMSAFRGYHQGLHDMKPTAITQIIEQGVKVGVGLTLAHRLLPNGVAFAAAGAMLGITLSELAALIVILFIHRTKRRPTIVSSSRSQSNRTMKRILQMAFPILIGASIMPMVLTLDTWIVSLRLEHLGYSLDTANALFGMFTGRVNPLINIPGMLSLALCVSIIPVISTAYTQGGRLHVPIQQILKFSLLIGTASAVGLFVLAKPIMTMLYGHFSPTSNAMAGQLLQIMAIGVLFLTVLQPIHGVFQGMGKVYIPVVALSSGALTKVVLGYLLVGHPAFHIYGAAISTVACYLVALAVAWVFLRHVTQVSIHWRSTLGKPLLSSITMGAGVYLIHMGLNTILHPSIATLLSIAAGCLIYTLCLIVYRVLTRKEVQSLLGEGLILRFYDRLTRH